MSKDQFRNYPMLGQEAPSMLAVQIEREDHPGSGRFYPRNTRAHSRANGDFRTYFHRVRDLGDSIAFVNGPHQPGSGLGVAAVIEVDDVPLTQPVVVDVTQYNTSGFTLVGDPKYDDIPGRSSESVIQRRLGPMSPAYPAIVQAGFTPNQSVAIPLGKAPDGKAVRAVVRDYRLPPQIS